ncbi:DUF1722 domain-containing protein [Filobacillus milosensis]|uniref:DUF1722 domain-containing protein n=1 Tax=Filobacillus milosensis TaxID=94137 RepID=A0A4Y8INF6_9BACI|nr:DUF1722 domain-containing protein [Filobacillus milosensis]
MVSNAFQHIYGYFRHELTLQEKEYFSTMIDQYRNKAVSISLLISQLKQWAEAYNKEYIKQQKILSLTS